MLVSCFIPLLSWTLFCNASQNGSPGLDSLHIIKKDNTVLNAEMYRENPQSALKHCMCLLHDNELSAVKILFGLLHDDGKTEFEHQVIDFVTGSTDEIKYSLTIPLLEELLPQFEDLTYFFQKCQHNVVDIGVNQCFVKALFKRLVNGDIKLADAFVIILNAFIRKNANKKISEEQQYLFGDYEMIDDPIGIAEEGLKSLFNVKNAYEVILSIVNNCLQSQNAELSKLRNQYLHGIPITDKSLELTEKQRFTNFLLFVVLPVKLSKIIGKLNFGKTGSPFILLLLLKAHDHLNVIPAYWSTLDEHLVTELLRKFNEHDSNGRIFSVVDAIRRCNHHLIDENHKVIKQLTAKKAALEKKKLKAVVTENKETESEQPKAVPETKAVVNERKETLPEQPKALAEIIVPVAKAPEATSTTSTPAPSEQFDQKKFVNQIRLYYAHHPERLKYFKPELLISKDISESERNCLLVFEVSFSSSAAKLLALENSGPVEKMNERMALKDRIYELFRQYAKDPAQIIADIANESKN